MAQLQHYNVNMTNLLDRAETVAQQAQALIGQMSVISGEIPDNEEQILNKIQQISVFQSSSNQRKTHLIALKNEISSLDVQWRQQLSQLHPEIDDQPNQDIALYTAAVNRCGTIKDTLENRIFELAEHVNRLSQIQHLIQNTLNPPATHHNPPLGVEEVAVTAGATNVITNSAIKLPAISIAPFNGQVLDYDRFVHQIKEVLDKPGLSESSKFTYLLQFLEADALQLVKQLPFNETSFSIAMDRLKSRYGNPSIAINAIYHQLSALSQPKGGTEEFLRFVNKAESLFMQLDRLGQDTNNPANLQRLIYLIPPHFMLKLEENYKNQYTEQGSEWSVKSLRAALQKLTDTLLLVRQLPGNATGERGSISSAQQFRSYNNSNNYNYNNRVKTESTV